MTLKGRDDLVPRIGDITIVFQYCVDWHNCGKHSLIGHYELFQTSLPAAAALYGFVA